MAEPIAPVKVRRLGIFGLIRQTAVADQLLPDDTIVDCNNVHFDRIGAVSLRPGIAILGGSVNFQALAVGLHNTQNGSMFAVFRNAGSARISTYGGASWVSNLADGTAVGKIRFVNFADRTICLNFGGTNMYSSMRFTNAITNGSTGWATTGNPIAPQGLTDDLAASPQPTLGEVYKSRMYVAGGDTDGSNIRRSRLWFSSVITSAGNITWDPANDFVDINPNDGENITALKRFGLELVIFKPNYIYRFKTSVLDPDPLIKVGTRSQESVIEGKTGLYFHHDTGFFKYTGVYPKEISRAISDIVNAIPFSYFENITSWRDEDHIYWSVGDLTIEGESWRNVVLRYTESSDVWTVYRTAQEVRAASDYNSGSDLTRLVATDNGLVATFNRGTIDIGEPIAYYFVTKWYEWGEIYNRKIIQEIIAICEWAQGSKLMYQLDNSDDWHTLGEIKKFIVFFKDLSIRFHRIRFKLNGVSTDRGFSFLGMEFPKIMNEGIVKIE